MVHIENYGKRRALGKRILCLHILWILLYYLSDCYLEVYVGRLNKEREVFGEENELFWSETDRDFFNMENYAGEGNIGHIMEQIRQLREALILEF